MEQIRARSSAFRDMSGNAVLDTLRTMANVQDLFEASDLARRLRRAGFAQVARAFRHPFGPDAFFGDVVLAGGGEADAPAGPVQRAACVFYSGVVCRPLLDGMIMPIRPERPELQAGIAFMGDALRDDGLLPERPPGAAASSSWALARHGASSDSPRLLVARKDLLEVIEDSDDDYLALVKARDDFFLERWHDLAGSSLAWDASRGL